MNDNQTLTAAIARLIDPREIPAADEDGARSEKIETTARTAGASAMHMPMLRLKIARRYGLASVMNFQTNIVKEHSNIAARDVFGFIYGPSSAR